MDVRAILVVDSGGADAAAVAAPWGPLALLDVLGCSVLQRVVARLQAYRVRDITALVDADAPWSLPPRKERAGVRYLAAPRAKVWDESQRVFMHHAHNGADVVLVARLGSYLEPDYDELLQAHWGRNARITAVYDQEGRGLDLCAITAARRNDAVYLLRHQLREWRTAVQPFPFSGYRNSLRNIGSLRQLAVDAFCGSAEIAPIGEQVRPGVWLGHGAQVQKGARVLAPAFVGRNAKVCRAAVITRCGVVEHDAVVSSGAVLEDATLLPNTKLGAGLDVAHAVAGFGSICDLRRGVQVEVHDARLIGAARSGPGRLWRQFSTLFARRSSPEIPEGVDGWNRSQPRVAAPTESRLAALASEPLSERAVRE